MLVVPLEESEVMPLSVPVVSAALSVPVELEPSVESVESGSNVLLVPVVPLSLLRSVSFVELSSGVVVLPLSVSELLPVPVASVSSFCEVELLELLPLVLELELLVLLPDVEPLSSLLEQAAAESNSIEAISKAIHFFIGLHPFFPIGGLGPRSTSPGDRCYSTRQI